MTMRRVADRSFGRAVSSPRPNRRLGSFAARFGAAQ